MGTIPANSDQPEAIHPWGAREALFNTGTQAALQLRRWSLALELNASAAASKRARGAPEPEIARIRFNDYRPLIQLGRMDDAVTLLLECRKVFEQDHDIQRLGKGAQRPRRRRGQSRPWRHCDRFRARRTALQLSRRRGAKCADKP